MNHASANVKAERLNHARELLQRFDHLPDAVAQMTSALVREQHWSIAKRNCQPGVARGPEAEKRAWLSALHRTATLFNWNIDSIVCSSKNWSKSTNCWCPRYVGQLGQ